MKVNMDIIQDINRMDPFPDSVFQSVSEIVKAQDLIGVTCAGKIDGAGAQALAIMSTILFCRMHGLRYFHTPLSTVQFDDGNPDWAGRWDRFFNLGEGEEPVPANIPVVNWANFVAGRYKGPVIIRLLFAHRLVQRAGLADSYALVRDEFRQKYFATPKSDIVSSGYTAAHIRRGDVQKNNHAHRFLPIEIVSRKISEFRRNHKITGPTAVISEGKPEDFLGLTDCGRLEFYVDEDPFTSFHRLVQADGIVMGKSAFSYTAALLSNARVVMYPWIHKPLSDWHIADGQGNMLPGCVAATIDSQFSPQSA